MAEVMPAMTVLAMDVYRAIKGDRRVDAVRVCVNAENWTQVGGNVALFEPAPRIKRVWALCPSDAR